MRPDASLGVPAPRPAPGESFEEHRIVAEAPLELVLGREARN